MTINNVQRLDIYVRPLLRYERHTSPIFKHWQHVSHVPNQNHEASHGLVSSLNTCDAGLGEYVINDSQKWTIPFYWDVFCKVFNECLSLLSHIYLRLYICIYILFSKNLKLKVWIAYILIDLFLLKLVYLFVWD